MLFFPPHVAQAMRLSTNKCNIWAGPYGTGKTFASLAAWLAWLDSDAPRGDRLVIVGHSETSVNNNVVPELRKLLGHGSVQVQKGQMRFLGRVARVLGGGKDTDADRIAGMNLASAYIDEASRLHQSMFSATLARLRLPEARAFVTTNPASPAHWLYTQYVKPAGVWLARNGELRTGGENPIVTRVDFGPEHNPALPASYWTENLARSQQGAAYRRYVLGEWSAEQGAIWPLTQRQVAAPDGKIQRYFVGIDYGTTNPTVALLIGEADDRRAYVLEELYLDSRQTGELDPMQHLHLFDRWMRDIDQRWRGARFAQRIFIDPAAKPFRVTLKHAGWPVMKANNDVLDGIRLVSSMMATDRLRIIDRCEHTIAECTGYAWDDSAQEKGIDAPVKQDDHCPDGLRYAAMGRRMLYQSWIDSSALASAA